MMIHAGGGTVEPIASYLSILVIAVLLPALAPGNIIEHSRVFRVSRFPFPAAMEGKITPVSVGMSLTTESRERQYETENLKNFNSILLICVAVREQ
jgi:hypothetical protein